MNEVYILTIYQKKYMVMVPCTIDCQCKTLQNPCFGKIELWKKNSSHQLTLLFFFNTKYICILLLLHFIYRGIRRLLNEQCLLPKKYFGGPIWGFVSNYPVSQSVSGHPTRRYLEKYITPPPPLI